MTNTEAIKLKTEADRLDKRLKVIWERLHKECPHPHTRRDKGQNEPDCDGLFGFAWDHDRCTTCNTVVRDRLKEGA